jgi:hypothetical protein
VTKKEEDTPEIKKEKSWIRKSTNTERDETKESMGKQRKGGT